MQFKHVWYKLIGCMIMLTALSCSRTSSLEKKQLTITTASGKTVPVMVEVAQKEEERVHGFMERKHIPDGTGMLFIFEKDQILSFWMKNTPTALSIAYFDSTGKIRNIYDMKPYSLAPTVSTVSVRYALEVPQGWFTRAGIQVGDVISNF